MVFSDKSKVHCFFEQSGTFKKQFQLLGVPAFDYDIKNDFYETDNVVDLFEQIRLAFYGDNSVFDNVSPDDLIFAFFPCYRFEDQSRLLFRGDAFRMKDWDLRKKITYSVELHDQLSELYRLFSFMVCVCLDRGYRLIVENPYSSQHYLTSFWPGRPSVIDMDRTRHGDWFKKPTQYWFFNCEPSDHCYLVGENYTLFDGDVMHLHKDQCLVMGCSDRKTGRSMIHSDYASWFISEFIL